MNFEFNPDVGRALGCESIQVSHGIKQILHGMAHHSSIIDYKFPAIEGKVIGYELSPCKAGDEYSIEKCLPDEAQFWSVYVIQEDDLRRCIGDFASKQIGESFIELLIGVSKHYHDADKMIFVQK